MHIRIPHVGLGCMNCKVCLYIPTLQTTAQHLKQTDHRRRVEVPCAPKWFDFEFPIIKTTKLVVETRPCT